MLLIIFPGPQSANLSYNGAAFVNDKTLARSSSLFLSTIGRRTSLIGPSQALAKLHGTFGSENTLYRIDPK